MVLDPKGVVGWTQSNAKVLGGENKGRHRKIKWKKIKWIDTGKYSICCGTVEP